MRFASGLVLSAAVLALSMGCGKKNTGPAGGGGDSIEGTYLVTSMEISGQSMAAGKIDQSTEESRTIKISADRFTSRNGDREDPVSYTIDRTKSPAQIDMISKKGDGKDEKLFGIYKVEGGSLIICLAESDKAEDRPKEFKTDKNGKTIMMTLTRKP